MELNYGSRLRALDGLRGVCCLVVVFYHYQIYWIQFLGQNFHFMKFLLKNAFLSVDIFFMISGFIIAYIYFDNLSSLTPDLVSIKKIKVFFQKRFFRLYPIYFLCCVCTSFFFLIAKLSHHVFIGEKQSFFSIKILLVNFMGIQSWIGVNSIVVTAWSLSIEFGLYIYFIAVMLFYSALKINPKVFASILCLSTLLIYEWFLFFRINENFMIVRGLGEFTLGLSIFLLIKDSQLTFQLNRFVKIGYFFILIFLLLFVKNTSLMYSLSPVLFSPLVIMCYFNDRPGRGFSRPSLVKIGSWSYSLYLIHPLLMNINSGLHLPATSFGNNFLLLECALLTVIPIFIASFVTKLIEVPLHKYLVGKFIR